MFRFLIGILGSRSQATLKKTSVLVTSRRQLRPTFELLESREVPSTVMVRDIYAGGNGSSPGELVNMNGKVFFTADDGLRGRELWRSDGTPAGTVMIKDIYTGSASSAPKNLTVVGNVLYFTADDGLRGRELWRSDGTPAGTLIVKDINPGAASSNPSELTAFQGSVYFAATHVLTGRELWRSNGLSDGTKIVRDINLGVASSEPAFLTAGKRQLFFRANDGFIGAELWCTDPVAGTTLVKDIRPGTASSNPFNLTKVGGVVFFGANDGSSGAELWRSDGTRAGTSLVKDINPGPDDSLKESPTDLMANLNGQLVFSASDGFLGKELWRSNGTSAGTFLIKDIYAGSGDSNPTAQQHPLPERRNLILNGVLYFGADDGNFGGELWRTDGSLTGTYLVRDINAGAASGLIGNQLIGAVYQSKIYFAASNGANSFNVELWCSDGTPLGTKLKQDINSGGGASSPKEFVVSNKVLFFAANNGLLGRELWRTS